MFNYTAMGLGNHEFDDGIPGLVPFIQQANFAVLAANIDATLEPSLVRGYSKLGKRTLAPYIRPVFAQNNLCEHGVRPILRLLHFPRASRPGRLGVRLQLLI